MGNGRTVLIFANYAAVLVFGLVLVFSFCSLLSTRRDKLRMALVCLAFGLLHLALFRLCGQEVLVASYPFTTHLPLFLLLVLGFRQPPLYTLLAILTAYLFCAPRQWFGFMTIFLLGRNIPLAFYGAPLLMTLPLLAAILHWFSPVMQRLKHQPPRTLCLLLLFPLSCYLLSYTFDVYTDLLYTDPIAPSTVMSATSLFFMLFAALLISRSQKQHELQLSQQLFALQAQQQKKEMQLLWDSQEQARIYRHDLRHHLRIIDAYLSQDDVASARSCIAGINSTLDAGKVIRWTRLETLNLILSYWLERAKAEKITVTAHIQLDALPEPLREADICLLLSNALENAVTAARKLPPADRSLHLCLKEEQDRLLLELKNTFAGQIAFQDGLPQNPQPGHGLGARSIAHIAETSHGIFTFGIEPPYFVLRMLL